MKTFKKLTIALMAGLLALTGFSVESRAAVTVTAAASEEAMTVEEGESFEITFSYESSGEDIRAVQMVLDWDEAVLEREAVTVSSNLQTYYRQPDTDGTAGFVTLSDTPMPQSGSVTYRFKALKDTSATEVSNEITVAVNTASERYTETPAVKVTIGSGKTSGTQGGSAGSAGSSTGSKAGATSAGSSTAGTTGTSGSGKTSGSTSGSGKTSSAQGSTSSSAEAADDEGAAPSENEAAVTGKTDGEAEADSAETAGSEAQSESGSDSESVDTAEQAAGEEPVSNTQTSHGVLIIVILIAAAALIALLAGLIMKNRK